MMQRPQLRFDPVSGTPRFRLPDSGVIWVVVKIMVLFWVP